MALTDLIPNSAFGNAVKSGAQWTAGSVFNPITTITKGRQYLDTLANKYLVKPKSAHGIGGFVFDYETEASVTLQAEVTEHYTENNTFVMDHVAHKPARVVLRGLVGELVAAKPQGVTGALSLLTGKLSTIPAMLGKYTPGALKKIQGVVNNATNTVNKIDNYISRAQNIVGLFIGSTPGPTRQHTAYAELFALWWTSQVVTVETPYRYFDSMVIEQITFNQDEDSDSFSEITVTLKEVRFVTPGSSNGLSPSDALLVCEGLAALQRQGPTNKGRTVGTSVGFPALAGAVG
jgi:hypothetical protein